LKLLIWSCILCNPEAHILAQVQTGQCHDILEKNSLQ
jgi:hypothetical protein